MRALGQQEMISEKVTHKKYPSGTRTYDADENGGRPLNTADLVTLEKPQNKY